MSAADPHAAAGCTQHTCSVAVSSLIISWRQLLASVALLDFEADREGDPPDAALAGLPPPTWKSEMLPRGAWLLQKMGNPYLSARRAGSSHIGRDDLQSVFSGHARNQSKYVPSER